MKMDDVVGAMECGVGEVLMEWRILRSCPKFIHPITMGVIEE